MSVPIIAFFNNKGGVGKTSLVYHLAWMYSSLNIKVVAADLDPQANLTAAFLDDTRLEQIWDDASQPNTIFKSIQPLKMGVGDVADPILEAINDRLALLVGDLALSKFEDELSETWPKCLGGDELALRITSAFWRIIQKAALDFNASIVLLDLGPNLGAINRAALIATDYVVVPLSPDLFSLRGLSNLGPPLRDWRKEWKKRLEEAKAKELDLLLPEGTMKPIGYVIFQHAVRMDRAVQAYERWLALIPNQYRKVVLEETEFDPSLNADISDRLASLKNYRSLISMAQTARKPIFDLKAADGAIGSHANAVREVYQDFKRLAEKIAERTEIVLE